ncbi:MAG TPA: hypothetical protein VK794_15550 [Steroidobacteraceae bacterium]|jgi:hypothetical protein|nr:hypothetical protein [Steroidobacteraceae bacterium]
MWRHPILKAILLAYIAWGAWHGYLNRTMHAPDGVLAEADPRQSNVANGEKIQVGRWTLTVRATYEITARVLGREPYHFDSLSDLVPEDLALGWGPMSDSRVLKTLEISQGNRFYYWHTTAATLIDRETIITHSANTHVIPQDSAIAHRLERLRPGEIVTLSGELVDGVRSDGRWIKTSLVRNDTGAGACEVMLVTDVRN